MSATFKTISSTSLKTQTLHWLCMDDRLYVVLSVENVVNNNVAISDNPLRVMILNSKDGKF